MKTQDEKKRVRVERVDTKCGSIGHMTVDQIRERTIGENVNVACPECGEIHLTLDEVEDAESRRITSTRRFQKIKEEAEA